RQVRFDAPAHVVSDGLRVRLPPELPVLAGGDLADGGRVALVGRFARLGDPGLREASLPSPKDAALVAGGRDEAIAALVARAARGGTLALTAALASGLLVVCRVVFAFAAE
ncbi:MAG: hypothetical protein AAF447_13460, partial [Myxococcota bacterium]